MKYEEFVGQVQNRARLGTQSAAVAAIRATLETLSERLAGDQAEHLAAQLPREVGYYLRQHSNGERFELDEFYDRVAEREHVDLPDAVYHARIVMGMVQEAVSAGEMDHVRSQLPDEFNELFTLEHDGRTGQQ